MSLLRNFSDSSNFSGGFKLNEVNVTGNSAIIAACINCCDDECPLEVDDVNADVSIVTKIFRTRPNDAVTYAKEIRYGNVLRRHDADQLRFVYSLPKTCEECRNVTLATLPERARSILRRANPAADDNTLLSSFYMYNTIALTPYDNIGQIPEGRKDFLRQSVHLLHTWGICHNDLHKFNILRGADGNPRIIDFGEASSFDPENIREEDTVTMLQDFRMLENSLRQAPPDLPRGRRGRGGGGGGGGAGRERSRSRSRSRSPRPRLPPPPPPPRSRSPSPSPRARSLPRARSRSRSRSPRSR